MNHHDAEFKQYVHLPAIIDNILIARDAGGDRIDFDCNMVAEVHVLQGCCGRGQFVVVEMLNGRTKELEHKPAEVLPLWSAWKIDNRSIG